MGIAALLPGSELVLPSLWEAITGTREVVWGEVDADGRNVFTPEMAKCWSWKDELPARELGVVGKHFGRWAALVAPRMLPSLYGLTGRRGRANDFREAELTPVQLAVCEAVLGAGPSTGPELRALTGLEKKQVDAAVVALQRMLVLTNAHVVEQRNGWGAIAVDLLARRWPQTKLPGANDAERTLAATVLASCGEVSAADLGGALGWRVKRSRETLDDLVERREANCVDENGLVLYAAPATRL
ncbi:MAG: crosslink repair DNA glycosylase YcaQ family protein [Actinomycetota bacterium]